MPKDYAARARTHIRYTKRIIDDNAWIRAFLHKMPYGVLATVYEGQPFALNNLFVYDEPANAIYMHTAQVGRTRSNVEAAEQVCFTIAHFGRFLPYPKPVDFDVEYESVVIFGHAALLEPLDEKRRALQMLMDKYAPHLSPGKDYEPIPDEDLKRTSVYSIHIDEWSAKKNEAAPDFPGAFAYPVDPEL